MKRIVLALCAVLIPAASSVGQVSPNQPTLDAASALRPIVHRLDFASSYSTNPIVCDSVPTHSELVRGTMHLRRLPPTPSTGPAVPPEVHFRVGQVNWLLTLPDGGAVTDDILITGHGTYRLTRSIGVLPVLGHQLKLTLRIGDEGPVVFDSGLVPRSSNFPAMDIEVFEVTAMPPCEQRIFRVAASVVRPREVHPYAMGNAASFSFQISPMGPMITLPIDGRFGLVNLPVEDATGVPLGLTEWALVHIGWFHGTPTWPGAFFMHARGGGIYQHFTGTFTGVPIERMQTELLIRGDFAPSDGQPMRFDSGLVNASAWTGAPSLLPFFHIPIEDTDPAFPMWSFDVVAGPVPTPGVAP